MPRSQLTVDCFGDVLPDGAVARAGTIRMRHGSPIASLAFSPDGKCIASADSDGVSIWDVTTGGEIVRYTGHQGAVNALAFGKHIASGGEDTTIRIWDRINGQELRSLRGHKYAVQAIDISADGRLIASGSADWTVRIWNAPTGASIAEMKGHCEPVRGVKFINNGSMVASVADNLRIWEVPSGKELFSSQKADHPYYSLAISDDGRRVATGSYSIEIWDADKWEKLYSFAKHHLPTYSLAFSPEGDVVSSCDNMLLWWNPSTGEQLVQHLTPLGLNSVAVSPDGELYAGAGQECMVRIYDSGFVERTLVPNEYPFGNAVFVADQPTLAAIGPADSVRFWNAKSGEHLSHFPAGDSNIDSLAVSPDGALLATAGDERTDVWSLREAQHVRCIPGNAATFSPNGDVVATCVDNDVHLYQCQSIERMQVLKAHTGTVHCLAFSPDGSVLVSAGRDGTIRFWSISGGKEIGRVSGHKEKTNSIWFSKGGAYVATCGRDDRAVLWDPQTYHKRAEFRHSNWVNAVVTTADEQIAVTGTKDRFLHLWHIATGRHMQLDGHRGEIDCLSLSSDGHLLASSSWDKTVLVWDTRRFVSLFKKGQKSGQKP